jgi:hypothetical protein
LGNLHIDSDNKAVRRILSKTSFTLSSLFRPPPRPSELIFPSFLISTSQATLSLLGTNNKIDIALEFKGKFDPSKDDLDCVAIFNPETKTFTLELLKGGQALLRHMPGSKRDKDLGTTKVLLSKEASGQDKNTRVAKEKAAPVHLPAPAQDVMRPTAAATNF